MRLTQHMLFRMVFIGLILGFVVLSCDRDNACEEGYVEQFGPEGSTFCIPEFEEGVLNGFNLGDSYFHEEHGVIRIDGLVWKNALNKVVDP